MADVRLVDLGFTRLEKLEPASRRALCGSPAFLAPELVWSGGSDGYKKQNGVVLRRGDRVVSLGDTHGHEAVALKELLVQEGRYGECDVYKLKDIQGLRASAVKDPTLDN